MERKFQTIKGKKVIKMYLMMTLKIKVLKRTMNKMMGNLTMKKMMRDFLRNSQNLRVYQI